MGDARKTVWVLGSGFSIPLGGPPLTGLLSLQSPENLLRQYPQAAKLHGPAATRVHALYRTHPMGVGGSGSFEVRRKGDALWDDAEEFLDYLDVAAQPDPKNTNLHLKRLTPHAHAVGGQPVMVSQLSPAARHIIAAECCSFLERGTESEQWTPFHEWARGLTPNDTV